MGVMKTVSTPSGVRRVQACLIHVPAEESKHIPGSGLSSEKIQQRRLDLLKNKRIVHSN